MPMHGGREAGGRWRGEGGEGGFAGNLVGDVLRQLRVLVQRVRQEKPAAQAAALGPRRLPGLAGRVAGRPLGAPASIRLGWRAAQAEDRRGGAQGGFVCGAWGVGLAWAARAALLFGPCLPSLLENAQLFGQRQKDRVSEPARDGGGQRGRGGFGRSEAGRGGPQSNCCNSLLA
jgi:hypothetical protein